jgi:hydroxymethylbilane synthase
MICRHAPPTPVRLGGHAGAGPVDGPPAPAAALMRIGTRGSALALAQANLIAGLLAARGYTACEIVPILTSGDLEQQSPQAPDPGDKSRWVSELEDALHRGEIDVAVHSAKDVPGDLADGLSLLGAPARAAAEDVLCGASTLAELAPGARVGTSSLRRMAQLRATRDDLQVVALRGNVDTRLRKLGDPGERLDAIVLARAGLQRLGREAEAGGTLETEHFVPAPGQGVIVLEGRDEDSATRDAVQAITDGDAFSCLLAERALAHALGASCRTPLGAYAQAPGCGCLNLRAWVGLPDGSAWASDELLGGFYDPEPLGRRVAERLSAVGGEELLRRAEAMADQAT